MLLARAVLGFIQDCMTAYSQCRLLVMCTTERWDRRRHGEGDARLPQSLNRLSCAELCFGERHQKRMKKCQEDIG
ncbi:hypothetical protein AMECASPLE_026488 [Ameca splendens]|uniref:Secreted protein n=1 Tax=Ameca splendens TaxID=208324 RepID=A0ABV0Z2V3_9TELE